MWMEVEGPETQYRQMAENWLPNRSNIVWTFPFSLWKKYINLLGNMLKLPTLTVDRFYELNALCDA